MENSKATPRQLWALYCITKKDYRNENLSKEEASKLISELGDKKSTKKTLSELKAEEEYDIEMEPIEALTRINHESPYSKEYPIRKIDSIETIPIQAGFCGHCCVAMLSGEPLCDVVKLMGKGPASWSKILEALDYYGISYAERAFYTKGEPCQLPQCAIVYNDNSFLLWYKGSFCGVKDIEMKKTVSYIEVFVV